MKIHFKIWIQARGMFAMQLLVVMLVTLTAQEGIGSSFQELSHSVGYYVSAMLLEAFFTSPQIGFHTGLLELLKGECKKKTDIMIITIISSGVLLYTSYCLIIFIFKKVAHLAPILDNPLFYQLAAISIIISLINIYLQRRSIYEYCNTPISIDIKHFSK